MNIPPNTCRARARVALLSARAVRRFPAIPLPYWAEINAAERLIHEALRARGQS